MLSNFMFVVPPLYGHITATLSVGGELIRRGHNVCWVSLKNINAQLLPDGGTWIVPDEVQARAEDVEKIMQQLNRGASISRTESLNFYFNEIQLPFANILNEGMQSVIDVFRPDVIIQDESAFSGAVAAVKNNIPYVTSVTSPPGYFEPDLFDSERQKNFLEKIREVQAHMGIDSERIIFNSDKLVISFTSPELLEPFHKNAVFKAPTVYVGPTIEGRQEPDQFDWSAIKNPNWPIIYVSIGTLLDDIRSIIFKRIVDAFDGEPLNIIVNTDPSLFDAWPENFIIQKSCPQLDILSKANMVITHAGFNTVNEALYFNLPMIAIPLAWDQDFNADLIETHGCGRKFKYRRMSPALLREATYDLLTQEHFRERAKNLGQSLRQQGGTQRAADLIEAISPHNNTQSLNNNGCHA